MCEGQDVVGRARAHLKKCMIHVGDCQKPLLEYILVYLKGHRILDTRARASKKLKCFSALFFVCTYVFFMPSVSRVMGAESEAISKVSLAENSLEVAYLSLLEADRAGGDVPELVALLNTALEYYSESDRALELGDYDAAIQLASKSVEVSNVVFETNINLIEVTKKVEEEGFRNQLFLSFGVVCLIVLFGFLGWNQFKVYYFHRVMDSRPEVIADES